MTDGRPPEHSTEEVLDAVDRLVEAGERDLCEGGVRPETLASELGAGCPTHTARKRLQRLAEEGYLKRVWGANPDGYKPRQSYLPADHPDAQEPEY